MSKSKESSQAQNLKFLRLSSLSHLDLIWNLSFEFLFRYTYPMVCPNCSESMKSSYLDNQYVNHCSSCGCTFFEENAINRITYDTARSLSEDKYTSLISAGEKHCPQDFVKLVPISNTEAVPAHITIFVCPSCSGVLAYPEDLLKFKKVQGTKIEYYKSSGKPFASLHSVLIFSFIMMLTISSYFTFRTLQNRSVYKSEASDLFKTLSVIKSGHYILIGFRTSTPVRSQILLLNGKTDVQTTRTISPDPKTVHEIILTDIDLADRISYRIILTDKNGKSLETELKKLVLTNQ